ITLVNKSSDKSFDFNIIPGKNISSINVTRLTAPAIDAGAGVTFGGASVKTDGTFGGLRQKIPPLIKQAL
ncbi:MAG: glycosyl hydrolase family 79 C-terminal domain-containing protein, partial [Mucilaginibacter sp.]